MAYSNRLCLFQYWYCYSWFEIPQYPVNITLFIYFCALIIIHNGLYNSDTRMELESQMIHKNV